MKYVKHRIYGALFSLFKVFPIKKNKITFIIDSKQSFKGNLDYIKKEFEKRGNFEFDFFYKDKISLMSFKSLATSRYVFLNDNFFPLAFMNFKDDTIVTQLWHAPGAFKKFGASSEVESRQILQKASKNTDFLIVSSKNIIDYYSEAFQIPKDKIRPLGLPRADYYFENHDVEAIKSRFCKRYNVSPDKKIILYAPTFRDEEKFNNVFDYLDLDSFNDALGEEYVLALRLHPKIKNFYSDDISSIGDYVDCSDYPSEQELLLITDILITDYSSIMIEFAMLGRPVVFFTYDFDSYLREERGFYFDFESTVPGPIVNDSSQLIDVIVNGDFKKDKLSGFVRTQFDEIDGKSSARVVDFLLNCEG
ncbi:CDP-glycerol glycerophosphotransferase family protein [uncultured Methanobrevibacter sp.]|uniref:CDP-glycerol glycerophosphotransferase family protein n=1 Tax=uncultured Methanobrevibacter sp. TaxID=253161 RepID=UPI00261DAF91|nr:CDP-glycerol glycerophosphotransferase family protein [uncultured Methanobrevibacter sp.]